ncbi:MAG: glutamate-5-semialdehyde dehydrogenase [Thermodesulfobacteriota bacterium]|nr:glutamate-5-semialdehyde dehydrogenase [Thermodesulfobacteriota bacterium]
MTTEKTIIEIAEKAKLASRKIAVTSTEKKNQALYLIAEKLKSFEKEIELANKKDLKAAEEKKISPAMLERLKITPETIESMIQGLKEVAALPDPVGEVTTTLTRPNGLMVSRMRIPLGVIAMIYESRPNVTVDAAALCFKSGNCAILRGGSEAFHSNMILAEIIGEALGEAGLDRDIIQVLPMRDRKAVTHLLKQEESIDLVIPRGGEQLIRFVVQSSYIPVLKHYKGVCHVYVDKIADIDQANNICLNSKTQRPGVCNAMETMLVHGKIAKEFLPKMVEKFKENGVEIRGCEKTLEITPGLSKAEESDWHAEYLDLTLAVKIVDTMDQAMDHIARYGSNHTDVIVTADYNRANNFIKNVSSSMVGVNASTRFNDGGELGLGAEIGISTSKLHAFGPMGLEELTTTKFVVLGKGHTRN